MSPFALAVVAFRLAFAPDAPLVTAWKALSFALAFAFALLMRAEYAGAAAQIYVFKPLATVFVVSIAMIDTRAGLDPYRRFVITGLLASLAGDILLMLPNDPFVQGLLAFLFAHVFYILAFTRDGGFTPSAVTGLPLLAIGTIVLALLWPTLGTLRLPVAAYTAVAMVMAWQALERNRASAHDGTWWAAVGAILFLASDSALGIARFRGDFPLSRLTILGTYYLAQWMIATSALVRAGTLAR